MKLIYESFIKIQTSLQNKFNKIWLSSKTLPLLKSNTKGYTRANGRNNTGRITCYHKGGGHKRSYRIIEKLKEINGIITSIEYDPNKTCFIASLYDSNLNKFHYIPAYRTSTIGDIILTGYGAKLHIGHTLPLEKIPEGTLIHNVSDDNTLKKSKYSKAAGTYCTLMEKTKTHGKLKLPSGKYKNIHLRNLATIGTLSTRPTSTLFMKKAGRSRWLNKRPTVRGVAMNPIDHPHGGGEGKKSGKNYTPWGKKKRAYKKRLNS